MSLFSLFVRVLHGARSRPLARGALHAVASRRSLSLAVLTVCGLFFIGHSHAAAQSCHAPSLRESGTSSWRASVIGSFASYSNSSYTGEYQGAVVKGTFVHPRVLVDLSLPYYRLVRNGLTTHGVGDLAGDLRVVAYRSDDGMLSVGPELALTLPTGDEDKGLGMGHVMLMPGGWLQLQHGKLVLIAQVAYGRSARSLDMSGHQHGGGYFPLVNPMNMQELEHAISLAYAVHESVLLEARALGAVPINSPDGNTREVLAGGVRVNAGLFDFGVEVQVPVVGTPFRTRTLLSAAAQW